MERFEHLLSEYLDGTLDEAGRRELAELAQADPGRLAELVDLIREDRILASELGEPLDERFTQRVIGSLEKDKTRFIRAVMSDVRNSPPRGGTRPPIIRRTPPGSRRRPGTAWFWWPVAVAGGLALLAAMFFASGGNEPAPRENREARSGPRIPAPPKEAPRSEPVPVSPVPAPHEAPALHPRTEVPAAPKGESPAAPTPPPSIPKAVSPAPVERPPAPAAAPTTAPSPAPSETTVAAAARVERATGGVTAGPAAVTAGGTLPAGFDLVTADDASSAQLRLSDGTRIELRGSSRLRDQSDARGRKFAVQGTIEAEVAKQPKDQPLLFISPHAQARVLGTKLRIVADTDPKKGTRLDVEEGRVELKNLAGKSVEVPGGHYAVAAADVPLTSRLARVYPDLAALYLFKEGRGGVVHDVSRTGPPLDLKIANEAAVRWSSRGLLLVAPTLIASTAPAMPIAQACKATNEISLEVWFRPATVTPPSKDGRILTVSSDFTNQDFMIGQDEFMGPVRAYFVRLRTTATDQYGKPALATPEGAVMPKLVHLVYTRAASGAAILYLDGVEVSRSTVAGSFAAWDDGYRLALGNEQGNDRPWLGEYHLAAIYSRALSADEVRRNLRAGAE